MVAQITQLSTPLPNTYDMTQEEFESATNTFISELPTFGQEANAMAAEVNALALNAEASAGELANAVWVSGTTYAAGNVRYSPVDFLTYRRKTAGAGTTDPSLDSTNWALLTKTSPGGSDTTSSAVDIDLTSTSGRLQIINMTAASKKVNLPAATTLSKGVPLFVVKNSGTYRFSVHDDAGTFICYVNPGQVLAFGCSDISTAAGVWTVSGPGIDTIYAGNSAEVLNAVDSRYIAVAMLTSTKAICAYKNQTTGYLWAVVLNFGSASGTPAAVNAEAVSNINIAAQSSSQATVIYQMTTATTIKGYVLDISGDTITPGAVATIHTNATSAGEQGTSLAALSSTQLLCAYKSAGQLTLRERVLDISGSTITPGAEVVADTTSMSDLYFYVRGISATKAMIVGSVATALYFRLQSITGSTPAPTGSMLSIPHASNGGSQSFAVCVMSATRSVAIRFINGSIVIFLIDISGTTPVSITSKHIWIDDQNSSVRHVFAVALDSERVYITYTGSESFGVDSLIARITGDDRIVHGEVSERLEPGVTSSNQRYLDCAALDSSHVMHVCRNASTFLSAKTLEISY